MTINPTGGTQPKDLTLFGAAGGAATDKQTGKKQNPRDKFSKQVSVVTLNPSDEERFPSLGDDGLDGSFSKHAILGEELRPFALRDFNKGKDPLEQRLENTVNDIFQKRKLMDSRDLVKAYGISEGESFSIQCWGDKQCDIPATCCSTFVCRWLCCCCSSCVTHSTPYEQLDKHLIRKECTTSYQECVDTFAVYAPIWFVKLFLQMQNARWDHGTLFSTEDMFNLKQEFFYDSSMPWVDVFPLLTAVNNMRMLTEADSILTDPARPKPSWTEWKILNKSRNSVELASSCKLLGIELSLELIAQLLLVMPTENEDFSSEGVMRKIYSVLCSNIVLYNQPNPGDELDPAMVFGLLLRILKKLGVSFTPSDILKALAFDCGIFADISEISFESQRRTLSSVRRALNSRHQFWYDRFNAQKQEPKEKPLPEISERGCSGCCIGCSSCCKSSCDSGADQMDGVDMRVITTQPATSSLGRSMSSLTAVPKSPAPGKRFMKGVEYGGIGYGLMSTAGMQSGGFGSRSVRSRHLELEASESVLDE